MDFLNNCCICMNKSDLKHMFEVDNEGVSHYNKLTSSIAEMNFKEMNDQRLICGECCVTLNTVYNFRQTCLRSKTNLITYTTQLQTSSQVSGTLSVRPKDIKYEIVNEEICIKYRNKASSSSFEDSNPLQEAGSIQFASVEEESEDGSAHEDATVDHVNGAHSDVKVKVEHQMEVEDEPYIEFSEIDIAEDPLAVVKEGPTSGRLRRKYICHICGKKYNHTNNLKSHMRMHTGERPYECEICKKCFTRKGILKQHMAVHSTNPYDCGICKKNFNRKSGLAKHMLLHSVERPHACHICQRRFEEKFILNKHMRLHSGERPYECGICKNRFSTRNTLSKHMRVHSKETPYECEICESKFKFKNALNRHMKDVHGIDATHIIGS